MATHPNKNVKWVIGIVLYTGKNTKIMNNSDKSNNKLSAVESKCNMYSNI